MACGAISESLIPSSFLAAFALVPKTALCRAAQSGDAARAFLGARLLPRGSFRQAPSFRFVRRKGQKRRKRNDSFRQTKRIVSQRESKSLKLLRRPIQPFRRIVCFQWVKPHFVSPFYRRLSFEPKSLSVPWAKERSPDLATIAAFSAIGNILSLFDLSRLSPWLFQDQNPITCCCDCF
jgi:hypothetical protein